MASDAALPSESPDIGVKVLPSDQRTVAGQGVVYGISIENRSDEAQSHTLAIRGLPQHWYSIDFDDRVSFPREQRTATLTVSVPIGTEAGQHSFQIAVRASEHETTVPCSLLVEAPVTSGAGQAAPVSVADAAAPAPEPPAPAGSGSSSVEVPIAAYPLEETPSPPGISLAPPHVTWQGEPGEESRIALTVRNIGRSEAEYSVSLDGLNTGWYTLPPKLRVSRGETLEAALRIHPPSRAKSGNYPFTVRVSLEEHPEVAAQAQGTLSVPVPDATPRRPREGAAATDAVKVPTGQAAQVQPPDVTLSPRSTFRFGPGEVFAQAVLTVRNRSTLIERYQITIDGLPEGWYWLPTNDLKLDPGASQQLQMRLNPKPGAGSPAGDYAFRIRVAPQGFPDAFAETGGLVSIAGLPAFDSRLAPAQARGRKEKYKLTLVNTGSVPLSMWMDGSDPDGMLRFQFPSPPNLEVGQEAVVPVWVGARRAGLIGPPETFDFQLRVMPTGAESTSAKTFSARFVHEPFLSFRFTMISVFLALLATLAGMTVSIGTGRFQALGTWVGCQRDSDYQLVHGGTEFEKDECGGAPIQEQCATMNPRPNDCPSAAQVPAPTAQPTTAPLACEPVNSFSLNAPVTVVGARTNVRETPGTSGRSLFQTEHDEPATVIGAQHQCADSVAWWNVRLDSGSAGWVAETQPGSGTVLLRPR